VAEHLRPTFGRVTLEIRDATTEDVDDVVTLWKRAAGPTALLGDVASVRRLLGFDGGSLLLAVDGEEIVGTIVAGWDGWRGNLYRLAVLPERRGQGIGRRLVANAEAFLASRGCPRVTAIVHMELGDAAPFWAKVGYEHDTEVGRFVRFLG